MDRNPAEFAGTVIITWPQPRNGAIPGWAITLTDAQTGAPINTVTEFTGHVHAGASDIVWVDLTMFTGADGEPLLDSRTPVLAQGTGTGTFPFLVTEMRVASGG
jgi:hypothetical protein